MIRALALDYDGTLAHHGRVNERTLAALERFRASGRTLLLVTGRELEDLDRTFAHAPVFDRIVGENGALVFDPKTLVLRKLAPEPGEAFVRALAARGVGPVSVGHVIVATWVPHQEAVLSVIREQGLELEIIFNKDAVMVLPSGVNKGTGLRAALEELGITPGDVVGVGDAENDHSLLRVCGVGVAVANAIPSLKERADLVTRGDHGDGVIEVIEGILANELAAVPRRARAEAEAS